MALTRKALGYLIIAYGFIFLSLALRTSWLTIFVLPIAIYLLASSKLPKTNPIPLTVSRQVRPTRSFGGEDITITITITNISTQTIDSFQIEDKIPSELKVNGSNRMFLSLKAGQTISFRYDISGPERGTYVIGPTEFIFSDTLRLRSVRLQLRNREELVVIPRIEKLGLIDIKGRRFGPWPGLVPSKRMGVGTEFFELAPYRPGVDLRRVNWNASARAGMLITNEFEGEQVIDVLVLLDCSESVKSALFDYDVLEFQVSFAASLCSQLIQQGNRVGISVYGAVRTWVAPGFGKRQLMRLLDGLATVKPGPVSLPIRYVVESVVTTILPARSLILLISPMIGREVVDTIEAIVGRGYQMVCYTPSASTKPGPPSESSGIARRIFAAERMLGIARARRMTTVLQLSPEIPVAPLLRVRTKWSRT